MVRQWDMPSCNVLIARQYANGEGISMYENEMQAVRHFAEVVKQ